MFEGVDRKQLHPGDLSFKWQQEQERDGSAEVKGHSTKPHCGDKEPQSTTLTLFR